MGKRNRPRVVVVSSNIPPAHTGAGLAALKYASRLEARGELAFVLTATEEPDGSWSAGDEALMRILRERTVRAGRKNSREKLSNTWAALGNLARSIKTLGILVAERRKYEIIHCFSPTWLSLFAASAAKVLGKKIVVEITLAGGDCPESAGNNRFRILHQRRMIQFRWADAIVCLSPLLKTICMRSGFPEDKVFVVPRAVDLQRFHPVPEEEKRALRKRLGLPVEGTLILFVGGIIPRKGIDLLLAAFRLLAVKDSEAKLVIVGPSYKSAEAQHWHWEILKALAEPDLRERIFYPGWQMNVDEYMQAADVFSLPSRREGFGNVFIEAMASGLPVVCLLHDHLTNYIVDGEDAGCCVPEADPVSLAEALAKAVERVRVAPEIARAAARRGAMERFSHERVDAEYEKIYRLILGELNSPSVATAEGSLSAEEGTAGV